MEYSLEHLEETARILLSHTNTYKLMLFQGEMGSGKTTLIKTICKEMGVKEIVSSPTFSIVNEYQSTSLGAIYHFDLYRLRSEAEAEAIGISEYLDSGQPCIVEWPEIAPHILANRKAARFTLNHIDSNHRRITLFTEQ